MNMELKVGMTYELEKRVERCDLADVYGSGGLPVFATPGMIALMEGAACLLVKQEPYNIDTVGIDLHVQHLRACKEGAQVKAVATLTAIEGRKLFYDVVAYDRHGEIGRGRHARYIIDIEKFMNRIED